MSLEAFASFCGVDVSERQLDVHLLPDGAGTSFAHTAAGIGRLVAWLASRERPLLVVEATGGLERALVAALGRVGIATAVVNPHQIRDFARAAGLLAKTDRLDAGSWRCSANGCGREPRLPGGEADPLLVGRVLRRRQPVALRDAERNRRRRIGEPALLRSLDGHLAWLAAEIGRIEAAMEDELVDGRIPRTAPLHGAAIDPGRQVEPVLEKPEQGLSHAAELGHLVDGEPDRRRLHAPVGILLQTVGRP